MITGMGHCLAMDFLINKIGPNETDAIIVLNKEAGALRSQITVPRSHGYRMAKLTLDLSQVGSHRPPSFSQLFFTEPWPGLQFYARHNF